jgi:hypothetical protein
MAIRDKARKKQGVTAWEALRDIMIASMNKGQFPRPS